MRKKFAGNLLLLIFANVLVKPFWILGIDRAVQNRVGPEDYGTYFALFNFSFIYGIVLDFGLNNFNNRAVTRHPSRLASYFPNLMIIKLGLAFIYFGAALLSAMLAGYSPLQLKMLSLLAINQVILSYILYQRSNLTALHLFKVDAVISILDRLLAIVFCSFFLYWPMSMSGGFSIDYFILSQTAALLITAVIAFIALRGRATFQLTLWRWRFVRAILLKSAPFALLGLLMTIYYRIDAFMLERMYSAYETGIYAQSYRLLDAVNQFGYLFGVPLLPLFASMIRRREDISQLLEFSAVLMFLFSGSIAILCAFFGSEIMQLMYHQIGPDSVLIFRLLMLSFIPISSVYIFGTLLTAHGSLKMLNTIAAGGIVINVALNLFMIPRYGALGTTLATLFTQSLVALLHIFVANVTFKLKWPVSLILKMSGFVLASLPVCWLISRLHIDWRLELASCSMALGLLIVALQLVPISFFRLLKAN